MIELPEPQVAALQELAARLMGSRKAGTELRLLARDLLVALYDACAYAGLDKVLGELAVERGDRTGLADNDAVRDALVSRLDAADVDGRGPRNEKPGKLVEALISTLGLTVVPVPPPRASLGGDVRAAVVSAIAEVLDRTLAAEAMRDAIVGDARARCDDGSFNKITAALDDRGMHMVKQPKVPLEAMQAVSRALAEARVAVISRAVNAAVDRAKPLLGEAAASIDEPVSAVLTPRDVAVLRACETPLVKTPTNIATLVLASLAETARIAWREPEQVVQPYAASRTFEIGDVIEHPKFGRGTVASRLAQRIDVDFADGKRTLMHVAPKK